MTDEPLLQFDGAELKSDIGKLPFYIGHRLTGHPLFQLESLVELATRLPEKSVEYNAGNIDVNQEPGKTPRNGLSIADTVRRIREHNSWMVLKNVEQDTVYRALLDGCLDEIKPYSEAVEPGMNRREGFIFISSPRAVTPFHIDPEQNFLLQVAGQKWVHQWDRHDRVVLTENDLERFCAFSPHRNLPYQERFEERARVFELTPGRGLHFPSFVPHWVKNGEEASVSFSITFRTRSTIRAYGTYRVNEMLRRYGMHPFPPGRVPVLDRAKFNMSRVIEKVRNVRETRAY